MADSGNERKRIISPNTWGKILNNQLADIFRGRPRQRPAQDYAVVAKALAEDTEGTSCSSHREQDGDCTHATTTRRLAVVKNTDDGGIALTERQMTLVEVYRQSCPEVSAKVEPNGRGEHSYAYSKNYVAVSRKEMVSATVVSQNVDAFETGSLNSQNPATDGTCNDDPTADETCIDEVGVDDLSASLSDCLALARDRFGVDLSGSDDEIERYSTNRFPPFRRNVRPIAPIHERQTDPLLGMYSDCTAAPPVVQQWCHRHLRPFLKSTRNRRKSASTPPQPTQARDEHVASSYDDFRQLRYGNGFLSDSELGKYPSTPPLLRYHRSPFPPRRKEAVPFDQLLCTDSQQTRCVPTTLSIPLEYQESSDSPQTERCGSVNSSPVRPSASLPHAPTSPFRKPTGTSLTKHDFYREVSGELAVARTSAVTTIVHAPVKYFKKGRKKSSKCHRKLYDLPTTYPQLATALALFNPSSAKVACAAGRALTCVYNGVASIVGIRQLIIKNRWFREDADNDLYRLLLFELEHSGVFDKAGMSMLMSQMWKIRDEFIPLFRNLQAKSPDTAGFAPLQLPKKKNVND